MEDTAEAWSGRTSLTSAAVARLGVGVRGRVADLRCPLARGRGTCGAGRRPVTSARAGGDDLARLHKFRRAEGAWLQYAAPRRALSCRGRCHCRLQFGPHLQAEEEPLWRPRWGCGAGGWGAEAPPRRSPLTGLPQWGPPVMKRPRRWCGSSPQVVLVAERERKFPELRDARYKPGQSASALSHCIE